MSPEDIQAHGDALYAALRERKTVTPLTSRVPGITVDDAYGISLRLLERRLADGETTVGKKIGATSKAVQTMLGIDQPDFGYLTDWMAFASGDEMPIGSRLIQPRAEGEIAFFLKHELAGPGVTPGDVLAATESVAACFEVVDSRIEGWKIKLEDTVADNASSGLFIVGKERTDPREVDFVNCAMVVEKNGEVLSTGTGAAALGSPLVCVAWLANALGRYGTSLRAGEVILSGSLVPLEPVKPGDEMRVRVGGVGSASVRFV